MVVFLSLDLIAYFCCSFEESSSKKAVIFSCFLWRIIFFPVLNRIRI